MGIEFPFSDVMLDKLQANRTARLFAGKELLVASAAVKEAQRRMNDAQAELTKLNAEACEIQREAIARAMQGAQ